MGIAIKGIKITDIKLNPFQDGKNRITGDYSLLSNNDKVLAKQGFNGYNDIEVSFSAETIKAMNELSSNLKRDIHNTLGITED